MINKTRSVAALVAAAALSLTACTTDNADTTGAGQNSSSAQGAQNEATSAPSSGDVTPPDFASETRPVPDSVREVVGPLCGEAERDGHTYDIIAIKGGERCDEAMDVVNDFVAADSQAVQEADDSWQAINNWRCGRGTRLEDEPTDAEDYTMNCWDARTRVLFMEQE